MSYVRIMTFNVQLLPVVPFTSSPGNEAKQRASSIGKAFVKLPLSELPDIVAFNEVFSEDGRDELLTHLSALYPHIIVKLDDCQLGEDSGLLLASRFPFLPLPAFVNPAQDGMVMFISFPDSAELESDALACKGVGIVQIDCPLGIVTIAFTHTQAFYRREDQYSKIRRKQFDSIEQALTRLLGPPPNNSWTRVVVMGDLNVRGDASGGEWEELFITSPGLFSQYLCDGWSTYMRPPSAVSKLDPGYTNNNLESGEGKELLVGLLTRLDYQCFPKKSDGALVPQHMRTRFRSLSDHWSLEADIHQSFPHCTPSDAIEWKELPMSPWWEPRLRVADLDFELEGTYQWIFVEQPGTYTIFRSIPLEVTYFAVDKLSDPWQPYDNILASEMGIEDFAVWIAESGLKPEGEQIDLPGPFFICVRGGSAIPDYTGACRIGIFRHTGESKASAIVLRAWDPFKNPKLPLGKRNGALDQCWFRADLSEAHSKKPYENRFVVTNSSGHTVIGTLVDRQNQPMEYRESDSAEFGLDYISNGAETIYFLLERTSLSDTAFRVGWQAGLTYLRSVASLRPMVLRCLDESGIDKFGADEINLKLYADDMTIPFFEWNWDNADTNEILMLEGHVPEIAFVDIVDAVVTEKEDLTASGSSAIRIPALSASDSVAEPIEQSFAVQSGTYRFECTLTRSFQ